MGPCGCAGAAVLGQAEGAEALCVRAAKPGAMSAEEQLELAEGSGSAPACRGGCCLRWGPRGRAGVGAGLCQAVTRCRCALLRIFCQQLMGPCRYLAGHPRTAEPCPCRPSGHRPGLLLFPPQPSAAPEPAGTGGRVRRRARAAPRRCVPSWRARAGSRHRGTRLSGSPSSAVGRWAAFWGCGAQPAPGCGRVPWSHRGAGAEQTQGLQRRGPGLLPLALSPICCQQPIPLPPALCLLRGVTLLFPGLSNRFLYNHYSALVKSDRSRSLLFPVINFP